MFQTDMDKVKHYYTIEEIAWSVEPTFRSYGIGQYSLASAIYGNEKVEAFHSVYYHIAIAMGALSKRQGGGGGRAFVLPKNKRKKEVEGEMEKEEGRKTRGNKMGKKLATKRRGQEEVRESGKGRGQEGEVEGGRVTGKERGRGEEQEEGYGGSRGGKVSREERGGEKGSWQEKEERSGKGRGRLEEEEEVMQNRYSNSNNDQSDVEKTSTPVVLAVVDLVRKPSHHLRSAVIRYSCQGPQQVHTGLLVISEELVLRWEFHCQAIRMSWTQTKTTIWFLQAPPFANKRTGGTRVNSACSEPRGTTLQFRKHAGFIRPGGGGVGGTSSHMGLQSTPPPLNLENTWVPLWKTPQMLTELPPSVISDLCRVILEAISDVFFEYASPAPPIHNNSESEVVIQQLSPDHKEQRYGVVMQTTIPVHVGRH
uniref:Uncharacterized protein n=1 Tax=Timema cristinae TaxID=61476 RepID=A0A7R9D8Y8_TIMCR|nr:unnamed protein product [Timema cristinae]